MLFKIVKQFISILLVLLIVTGTGGVALFNVLCGCNNSSTLSIGSVNNCCHDIDEHACDAFPSHFPTIDKKCCSVEYQFFTLDFFEFHKSTIQFGLKNVFAKKIFLFDTYNIQETELKIVGTISAPLIYFSPRERLILFQQLRLPSHTA